MSMYDKIIVTNRTALLNKYGNSGLELIGKAIEKLVVADEMRGITSSIVYLDDVPNMEKVHGRAVMSASDPHENKDAIDSVFRFYNPHYIMILGAPDVVPHQDLHNPVYLLDQDGDDDDRAFGDLPYACDAQYSQDPARFVGPTRVVGRLPDLFGASEPSYLTSLLKIAAEYKTRSLYEYTDYFGLSAGIWEDPTRPK